MGRVMKDLRCYILLLFFPFFAVSMDRDNTKEHQLVPHNPPRQIKTCNDTWSLGELLAKAKQKRKMINEGSRLRFFTDDNFLVPNCRDLFELSENQCARLNTQLLVAISSADCSLSSDKTKKIKLQVLNVFTKKIEKIQKIIKEAPKILQEEKRLFSRKLVTGLINSNKTLVLEKGTLINALARAQGNIEGIDSKMKKQKQEFEENLEKENKEIRQKLDEVKGKLQTCEEVYREKYKKLKEKKAKEIMELSEKKAEEIVQCEERHDKKLKNTKILYFFGGTASAFFVAIIVGVFKGLFNIGKLSLFSSTFSTP